MPPKLLGALHALYEHYEKMFVRWTEEFGKAELKIPPVFIVVCQNTSHSKLLYDYIAGYTRTERTPEGEEREVVVLAQLPLFSNYDADRRRLARPLTLLIDSTELDSGDALSTEFRSLPGRKSTRSRPLWPSAPGRVPPKRSPMKTCCAKS